MTEERLQRKLSALIPLKHFVLLGYARNGLYLLIKAMDWDNGSEIIIPAFTCSTIPVTIREAGALPVPVDSENDGLNIDPQKIEAAITSRTKAIYVIHTYGSAARIEQICTIAKNRGIIVMEDMAHALFSTCQGKQLGTFGDFALLSFSKQIINYGGGAIGTNRTEVYQRLMELRKQYYQPRSKGVSDSLNNIIRFIGSLWETHFSLSALFLLKLLDVFNMLLFKGNYGLTVDHNKFYMKSLSLRLSLKQLDSFYKTRMKKDPRADYLKVRNTLSGLIHFPGLNQRVSDTLPLYYVGTVLTKRWLKLISFRTWRNPNEIGKYPRADFLYSGLRVFSWAVHKIRPDSIRHI